MNPDTVNYVIDTSISKSFFWNGYDNNIMLGMSQVVYERLTKTNNLNEFISDCLTHEHIHKYLNDTMGDTICSLFDAIGHNFENYEMFIKMFSKNPSDATWKDFIKEKGFDAFAEYYNLSHYDLVEAGVRKE